MKGFIKIGMCLIAFTSATWTNAAETSSTVEPPSSMSFNLIFRSNDDLLLREYRENEWALTQIDRLLSRPDAYNVLSIQVTGPFSPDRNEVYNRTLVRRRTRAMKGYLVWKYRHIDQYHINTALTSDFVPIWLQAVKQNPNVPNRDKVLEILRSNISIDANWTQIRMLNDEAALYINREIYPYLRNAVLCTIFYRNQANSNVQAPPIEESADKHKTRPSIRDNVKGDSFKTDSVSAPFKVEPVEPPLVAVEPSIPDNVKGDSFKTDRVSAQFEVEPSQERKTPFMAIKTDLVQWVGLTPAFDGLHAITPNLGIEFYFANRWSVEASYSYSNWNAITGDKNLWAVSRASIEPRYWLKNNAVFRGFYFGAYGNYGSYDTQTQITGNTGTYYSVGITAGYLHELSKHWAIELGVRGGYQSAANDFYDIKLGHYYHQASTINNQFAPQVKLSIVYRIGKK